MPTVTEGSRAGSGPLAVSVSLDNMEEGRRSPTNLLIDTMELVEARKTMHVPNHLLETSEFYHVLLIPVSAMQHERSTGFYRGNKFLKIKKLICE